MFKYAPFGGAVIDKNKKFQIMNQKFRNFFNYKEND